MLLHEINQLTLLICSTPEIALLAVKVLNMPTALKIEKDIHKRLLVSSGPLSPCGLPSLHEIDELFMGVHAARAIDKAGYDACLKAAKARMGTADNDGVFFAPSRPALWPTERWKIQPCRFYSKLIWNSSN